DWRNGGLLTTLAHPLKVASAAYTVDERFILTMCQDGTCRLWDSDKTKIVFEFPKAPDGRMPAFFSGNRRLVALRDSATSMQVWDVGTFRPLDAPLRLPAPITCASFCQDPATIAVSSNDGTVGIWSLATSSPITPPLKLRPGHVTTLKFSPDGRMLAAT